MQIGNPTWKEVVQIPTLNKLPGCFIEILTSLALKGKKNIFQIKFKGNNHDNLRLIFTNLNKNLQYAKTVEDR